MEKQEIFGVLVRVSTEHQAVEGDSIEMQTNLANEIIKEHNGVLYKLYLEEGVSATKNRIQQRPKLLECINDIKTGAINHLIVYRRDRLVRNTEESIIIRNILKDNNCKLSFSARGESPFDFNDPYAILMENVRASLDEIEAIQISMRVSDTMIDKAKRGEFSGGNLPYGYQIVDGMITPIESEIPKIEEIVELYLKGYGVATIARYMNGEETTGLGKRFAPATKITINKNFTDVWTRDTIKGILFNSMYTGYTEYTSKRSKELGTIKKKSPYIIPIRDEEIQLEINRMNERKSSGKRNPKKYNTPFLLSGLLTCGICGSSFKTYTTQKKDSVRYSYYKCEGRHRVIGKQCTSKSYKKELIESYVIMEAKRYLQEFVNSDTYDIVNKNLKNSKSKIHDKLEEINKTIRNREKDFQSIRRLILDLKSDDDDEMNSMIRNTYLEDQKEILKEISALKITQAELAEELESDNEKLIDIDYIISTAEKFSDIVENLPIIEQKKLIENLFSHISIDENGTMRFVASFDLRKNSSSKEVAFISLGGVGEPSPSKSINSNIENTFAFSNLDDKIESTHKLVKENILNYVFFKKPTIPKTLKGFSEATHISEHTYRLYKKQLVLPSVKIFNNLMEAIDSNEQEFADYLNRKFKANVTAKFLLESLTIQAEAKNKYLFSRKIKCTNCDTNFLARRKPHSYDVYYICNSINKEYCGNYKIGEIDILRAINKHTNLYFDEELISRYIDYIKVFNNGDFTVYFKKDSQFNVLNVRRKDV